MSHDALYIVDNSNEKSSVKNYLSEWCSISKQMDIATGYFEIGGLLTIGEEWQKLDKIRIILGNEMTKRTKGVIEEVVEEVAKAMINRFRESVEREHEKNEFLIGVPAIIKAMKSGKIECRVYDSNKFHAKAYITYFRDEYLSQFISAMNIPNGYALVGSSNFTKAGLTQNIELNVQVKDEVEQLQKWFEEHWENGTDITEAVLKVMENHCREFSPYDVYLRSMYEYFKSHEETVSEWEENESVVYKVLAQYQKDGYNSLIQIAGRYSGAFLCDGVGLGKTYIGMMLIERFVKKERKNVVLIVPAAARVSVWEVTIKKLIPEIFEGFYPFKIINHTDLLLEKNQNLMDQITQQAEIIIIDEAHHFRNRSSNRYRKLFEMMQEGSKKQMYMLTATPINNSFLDLQHLIELFTHRQNDYFEAIGIHKLSGYFLKLEAMLNETHNKTFLTDDSIESELILRNDPLVNTLVVQRSRSYVKKSLSILENENVLFSKRLPPEVAEYSLKSSYGKLIDDFVDSFYRKDKETGRNVPILALSVYSPYEEEYFIGDESKIDEMKRGRQNQVVNLIRQLLLKRFESSCAAFEETCIRIFVRLRKFLDDYRDYGNKRDIDRFYQRRERIIKYIQRYLEENTSYSLEDIEDDLPDYVWDVEDLLNVSDFDIPCMLQDTIGDLEVLSDFIDDLMNIKPENDDKINELKNILINDNRIKGKKVLIFTEYKSTAKYIERQLKKAGISGLFELDSDYKGDRRDVIERFAPYYNDKSSSTVNDEIRVLIATDVLAEGLNLQDATCLINYELHWNPVKLMQRIGRVDRRRNKNVENLLLNDHPELENDRDNIYYWNFLPPSELERLLSLYKTVSQKTLRISKTFGIEGKQLLTPEDDYEALKDFNSAYEGTESKDEEMLLEYHNLLAKHQDYETTVLKLPRKMFSGKLSERKGMFFCYELPQRSIEGTWSESKCAWYFIDSETYEISTSVYDIWQTIKTTEGEARVLTIKEEDFKVYRKKVEKHIDRYYMRSIQAPVGVNYKLITWIQLV